MQLRVLLEVLRLEVVGPEHLELFLADLGVLLLDPVTIRTKLLRVARSGGLVVGRAVIFSTIFATVSAAIFAAVGS